VVRPFALVAVLALGACAPAPRRGLVAQIAVGHRAAAAAPEPPAVSPPWHDPLFAGAEAVAHALQRLAPAAPLVAGQPLVGRDLPLERRFREESRSLGRRDVRTLFAFATICRVDAPVAACAQALLDPDRERKALDADSLVLRGSEPTPDGLRRTFSVEMLRMGEGPFRYDFRWDFTAQRRDRPDGKVVLRYEMASVGRRPEHVSVFRGAALLEPDGAGTRWTEVLLVGSDLSAPFFLQGKAEAAVRDILARRWRRLASSR
jgi:hypothetical protein